MNISTMPSPQEREVAGFALAVANPVDERAAFLQAVCGADGVRCRRVEFDWRAPNPIFGCEGLLSPSKP